MNTQAELEDQEARRMLAAMTGQDPRSITLPPRSTGVSIVSAPTGVFDWAIAAESLEEEIRCALGQLEPGALATETMSAYLMLERAGKALDGFQRGKVERNPEQKTRAFHLYRFFRMMVHEGLGGGSRSRRGRRVAGGSRRG